MKFKIIFIFVGCLFLTNVFADIKTLYEAHDYYKQNKFHKAKSLYKKFIKENPYEYDLRDAFYFLSRIEFFHKKYFESISYLNILNKRFPHSKYRKILLYRLGESYYKVFIKGKTEYYLKRYLSKALLPKKNILIKETARFYLAELALKGRDWKLAAKRYRQLLSMMKKYRKLKNQNRMNRIKYIHLTLAEIYGLHLFDKVNAYEHVRTYLNLGGEKTNRIKFFLRKLTLVHLSSRNGLPDNSIADIKVDGDDVYIATWTGGLIRFIRSTGKFEKVKLPSNNIRQLYITDEELYICTYDGIFVFDKTSNEVHRLSENRSFRLAQKIVKDDKYLYFSTLLQGVVKYDEVRNNVEVLDQTSFLGTNSVYALASDYNYLAFGTLEKGLILFDKKNNTAITINKKNKRIKGNNVKAILIDGRYIWFGVHTIGVYRYDTTLKKIKFFNWNMRYPTTIAKKGNEIWVGSSGQGIHIYNQATEKNTKLTGIEGLRSNNISHIQIEGDYVWVGYLDRGIDIMYRPN